LCPYTGRSQHYFNIQMKVRSSFRRFLLGSEGGFRVVVSLLAGLSVIRSGEIPTRRIGCGSLVTTGNIKERELSIGILSDFLCDFFNQAAPSFDIGYRITTTRR